MRRSDRTGSGIGPETGTKSAIILRDWRGSACTITGGYSSLLPNALIYLMLHGIHEDPKEPDFALLKWQANSIHGWRRRKYDR